MVVPISQTYIDTIKAFRDDCDTLIDRFKKKKNKDAKTFISIWKSLHFNLVYENKYSKHGMDYDFEYDTLQIAKLIMLRDDFSGGMFLLYGLHCLLDCPLGDIRVELEEFRYILKMLRLKEEGCSTEKYELTWIFSTLLQDGAFDFIAFSREYDMEGQQRAQMVHYKKYEFFDDDNPKTIKPKEWLCDISKDFPQDLKYLDDEYLNMKNKVKQVFPSLNLSLDMVQEDLYSAVLKLLTQANDMVLPEETEESIGSRRQALKNRKLKIKHRYMLQDTDEETDEHVLPPKKTGRPRGETKYFFKKLINEPDENAASSDEGDDNILVINPKRRRTGSSLPKI